MNDQEQRAAAEDVAAMMVRLVSDVEPAKRGAIVERVMDAAEKAAEELEVPWVVGNTIVATALLSTIYLAFINEKGRDDADGHYLRAIADGFDEVWTGIAAAAAAASGASDA